MPSISPWKAEAMKLVRLVIIVLLLALPAIAGSASIPTLHVPIARSGFSHLEMVGSGFRYLEMVGSGFSRTLQLTAVLHAQEPTEQQGEFVPAESLPQRERVPAAPLLVSAYAFVLVALFAYVISLSRRLRAVNMDIGRLEGEIKRGTRA
jgi:hypothetical protein